MPNTPLITIFTPTFNRAHTLPRLFQSLCEQTSSAFEWLVVDDGSADGTAALLRDMQSRAPFPMRVLTQRNGGKHRAINAGVASAHGELFFIVDSDDNLLPDAASRVEQDWADLAPNPDCRGLCYRRRHRETGVLVGPALPRLLMDATHVEISARWRIWGDKAEIFRTQALRENPFPEIVGETFVPEALIWERIADQGFMRFVDIPIYECEYLADGYSRNFAAHLRRNPRGFLLYYRQAFGDHRRSRLQRLKALVRGMQCQWYVLVGAPRAH